MDNVLIKYQSISSIEKTFLEKFFSSDTELSNFLSDYVESGDILRPYWCVLKNFFPFRNYTPSTRSLIHPTFDRILKFPKIVRTIIIFSRYF